MDSFLWIFGTCLSAGVLVGTYYGLKNSQKTNTETNIFASTMLASIIASLLTPVILGLVGNSIVSDIEGGGGLPRTTDVMSLFGYSLIIAIYSDRLLSDIHKMLSKMMEKYIAEDPALREMSVLMRDPKFLAMAKHSALVGQVANSFVEPDTPSEQKASQPKPELSNHENEVLSIFRDSTTFIRSSNGIAAQLQMTIAEVEVILLTLVEKGLITRIETSKGIRWSLI